MITKNISGAAIASVAMQANGGGINESIPMTRREVHLSRKQLERDSEIAKELIYLADIRKDPRLLVGCFYENRNRLSHQRFWEFLKTVWISAGAPENYDMFRKLFSSKRPFKYHVMSPEEERFLASLPEEFTVYRVIRGPEDNGLSWTLDEEFAKEYAESTKREMITRVVKKHDVFAYFDRRGESEIVIL